MAKCNSTGSDISQRTFRRRQDLVRDEPRLPSLEYTVIGPDCVRAIRWTVETASAWPKKCEDHLSPGGLSPGLMVWPIGLRAPWALFRATTNGKYLETPRLPATIASPLLANYGDALLQGGRRVDGFFCPHRCRLITSGPNQHRLPSATYRQRCLLTLAGLGRCYW